jgi:excisionase family DNA binding protein
MLPAVELVDALPPAALPAFIAQLAALQARAAARLVASPFTVPANVRSDASGAAAPAQLDVMGAAEFLGVSPTALRRLERGGAVPSVRIGRRVLFRRESLLRFLADHEHTTPMRS